MVTALITVSCKPQTAQPLFLTPFYFKNDGEDWHPEQLTTNDKDAWATPGQVYLFAQFFKPITTAHRQVTMKESACTIERVEVRVSINIVDRTGNRFSKTIETWRVDRVGVYGSQL